MYTLSPIVDKGISFVNRNAARWLDQNKLGASNGPNEHMSEYLFCCSRKILA
jgi:hypothetical protein